MPRSALLFAVAVFPPAALRAQAPSAHEEGIVEIVAERLAPITTIVLVDSAGTVLLPVELTARFLGLDAHWTGTSIGVPSPGGVTARFDTASAAMTTSIGVLHLARAEFSSSNGILYMHADRLAMLFDADAHVDMARLTIVFTRGLPFPAQQRIVAEQRRAVLLSRQQQQRHRAELGATPYRAVSGAGILDWEVGTNGLDPSRLTTIRTDAGVAVFGGDLGGGAVFQIGHEAPDAVHDPSIRYHRVFPTNRFVKQIQAGDMLTNGLFSRYVRGFEISSRPYLRSGELGSILIAPDLPMGWEYEVIQGNQLIGYSDIGTIDPVSIQLRAGTTPVQVRMYGPAGEEVVSTLVYQMPVSMIPSDSIEYAIGGGRCVSGCETYAHADVRYGASNRFTIGGGFELLTDSTHKSMRPYFVYSMASGTRATAELTYMPFASYSGNLALYPRDRSSVYVRGNVSRPGFGPVSLVRGMRMRWDGEVFWDERVYSPGSLLSQVRFGAAAAGQLGGLDRMRLSGAGSFRSGYAEMRYDHDRISINGSMVSGRVMLFTPFKVHTHTFRPLVNTALGVGNAGLHLAEIGMTLQPRANAIVTAGAQWSRGSSRPALSIGYSATVGSVHSSLRAVSSASGVASSSFMVRGSSSFVHDGSVTFQPWSRTGYAGLHGTVYVDSDGDGRFSEADEVVPDVHLIAGGHRVIAGPDGKYRVWSLHPYEPLTIAIDSARTPDPSWTMIVPEYVVRPAPNMALRTDIQLVRTRELIGVVEAGSGVSTAAGVTIDIVNIDTRESTTTVTFSDGTFYVSRIRPGRYGVAISASSLAVLGALAVPDRIELVVPASGDDLVVELEPIRLERLPAR